jgi:hypothetical protein
MAIEVNLRYLQKFIDVARRLAEDLHALETSKACPYPDVSLALFSLPTVA